MTREKRYFGAGLLVGILLATLFLNYFAPRYRIVNAGDALIKQDRWSGDSWRFVDGQWKTVGSADRDWAQIDQSVRAALDIPANGPERGKGLALLRQKYPVLRDVTDDELLDRIKVVYSKEILCNLYLNNLLKGENRVEVSQLIAD